MKVLIVPDVHGRLFWRKAKELVKEYKQIVFLGDYLDPYPVEGITPREAFSEFKDIIEFKKAYPKKVTLLLGNHDLHYYFTDFISSTRKNYLDLDEYHKFFVDNRELFTCFKVINSYKNKWVLSHAGISIPWLNQNNLSLTKLFKTPLIELKSALEQVCSWRGGYDNYSSPVWLDIHEAVDDNMLLGCNVTQIVGHNQVGNISNFNGITFVDLRNLISLDTKTKKIDFV
jgi:predicted phosphodiesterase